MRGLTVLLRTALLLAPLTLVPIANAQIGISVGPPVCPYGYYNYSPYPCAPYGYYGPDWFEGGVFIGTGPWYHGHHGFYGHVDNRYDPHHGYHGPLPARGDEQFNHFRGNEARDGHGHTGSAGHDAGGHDIARHRLSGS